MVKDQLQEALKKVLQQLGIEDATPQLEAPVDSSHGDYSSNVAMVVFKKYQVSSSKYKVFKTPLELAQELANILNTQYLIPNTCSRVEVAPPGFINFWLSTDYLITQLQELLDSTKKVAKSTQTIVIEFTDPNPFKEFHIGHLYSNIVGESLSRLFEASRVEVKRVNYQGDVGLHVAKALYGLFFVVIPNSFRDPVHGVEKMLKQVQHDIIKRLEEKALHERIKILGEAYAAGSKAYEEDQNAKKEINELNKKIYELTSDVILNSFQDLTPAKNEMLKQVQHDNVLTLYQKGRQWSLDYFEEIYKRLGTKFTHYYFESEVGKRGVELVKEHIADGIFEKSEGAVIFPGKKHGLHNRVFINSLGLPTYEAKELGLAHIKYDDFKYDASLIVTGNEIKEYFIVLLKALSLINPELAAKTRHIPHGMVRLPSGKMSSRTGSVVTGEWLLDETKKAIIKQYKDMPQDTAELVAIGAVKYALLKSNIGSDITFDFHESINLQGNSGPYLQYTYVRTQSVIRKAEAKIENFEANSKNVQREKEELDILRLLVKFDEVVENATQHIAPNLLCNYLFELAQAFNLFYQKHKILPNVILSKAKDLTDVRDSSATPQNDISRFRLALTAGVGQVLKQGLHLLGIEAPERM